jgi:hypothetical protein
MAGLVPAIHVFGYSILKTWMPATSAGMTNLNREKPGYFCAKAGPGRAAVVYEFAKIFRFF